MKLGVIESTSLAGKHIILEPRENLDDNEYYVSEGTFFNGVPKFTLYCLVCEHPIPTNGCYNCINEKSKNTEKENS